MGWNKYKVALVVLLACCSAAPLCFGADERGTYRRHRDTIWAEELEVALERGDDIYLDSCYVRGRFDFPDSVFGQVNVSNTTFESGVGASGTKFHSEVYFTSDTLNGIFVLQHSHLAAGQEWLQISALGQKPIKTLGTVFRDCVFRSRALFISSEIAGLCLFEKLRFDSSVTFSDMVFVDSVVFDEADFKHSVGFSGMKFESGGVFRSCTFTNARIETEDLHDVRFSNGVFDDVIFETSMPPPASGMASMSGLTTLSYINDPTGLQGVRQSFKTDGFRRQERQLTFALKRRENEINRQNGDWVTYYLNLVLFDWTCDYGMSYLRPLRYATYVWVVCTLIYAFFALWRRGGDIVVLTPHKKNQSLTLTEEPIRYYLNPENTRSRKRWRLYATHVTRLGKTLLGVMFFSLMSAFNIGFRDFKFGRWLRLLLTKEIYIKAVGWARTVSGIQALLSVYFFALFILSYFGRPFE